MVLLGAIWGGSFLFMRISVPEFGPIALIQVRVAISAVFLLVVLAFLGQLGQLYQSPWKMLVVGLSNSAVPYTLFALGTGLLSAGFASVLNATAPFFGAILGVTLFRDRLSAAKWSGLAIGFAGVLVLVAGNRTLEGSVLGIGVCLLAAFSYAAAAHYTKRELAGVNPMVIATACQIAASLSMIPVSIFTWPEQSPSMQSWLSAIALGVVCTGAALAIYFYLIGAIGATRSISVAYLIPLFGVLWGCIFLNESITWSILLGGAMILTGLFFISRSPAKTSRATEQLP